MMVVVCVGCYGSGERDAMVEPRGAEANGVRANGVRANGVRANGVRANGAGSGGVASERVAMSREKFVYYVANETVGGPDDGFILFLKIPGRLTPKQRADRYTGPMGEAFEKADLGRVISAAAMMGAKPFAGVSVEVSDLESGIAVIVEALRIADAPEGTEIRYGEGDNQTFMKFDGGS